MNYQGAIAALAARRYSADIEQIREVVEEYNLHAGSSNLWESSCLLLLACDVLSSHDFGDHEGQAELIHAYAQQALLQSGLASIDQELRLLAHLVTDFEDVHSSEPWSVKRYARAGRWLRALEVLSQDTRDFDFESLPAAKTTAPAQDLPAGVAALHVKDSKLRNQYRRAVNRNRHAAERFAFQWRMTQLRRVYFPLATKYIASAYAREPYNLAELKQLLDDYPFQDERSRKDVRDVSTKDKRSGAVEPISIPGAAIRPDQSPDKTKPAKVKAGRKAPARKAKRGKS
jgi:hypothetical protein